MMLKCPSFLTLSLTSALAAGSVVQLLNQTESLAVYTTAGISRHGTGPTVAFATALNPPLMVEVYSGASVLWSFTPPRHGMWLVDSARHAVALGVGAADTVGALFYSSGEQGNCTLFAWSSAASNATLWATEIAGCFAPGEDDSFRSLDMSDDGSVVAVAGYTDSTFQRGIFYTLDGQTGAVLHAERGLAGGAGPVQVSANGQWVAHSPVYLKEVHVVDARTGALRGAAVTGTFIGRVTDSADFLVADLGGVAACYLWNSSAGEYDLARTWPLAGGWRVTDVAVSSDAAVGELAAFLLEGGQGEAVRVLAVELAEGATLLDVILPNSSTATLRMDGVYVGLALEGSIESPGPTAVLLKAGASLPLLAVSTPGSMHAVDVVVDGASVIFAVAGKHVNDGEWGNGGDAFAWMVTDGA